jgi:hypothetical protein
VFEASIEGKQEHAGFKGILAKKAQIYVYQNSQF